MSVTENFEYGKDNLASKYTYPSGKTATYTYDGILRRNTTVINTSTPINLQYVYNYSLRGEPARTTKIGWEHINNYIYEYEYDANGNITKINRRDKTIENSKYPRKLKNISNPPAVLYVKGELPDLDDKLCISIVGTRNSSAYGNKISFEMGYKLAKADVVVISGGAIGIDCLSQKGALQAGGKTIAVLGCGINFNYLMSNKNLRN